MTAFAQCRYSFEEVQKSLLCLSELGGGRLATAQVLSA
jgi:hypothetical protein